MSKYTIFLLLVLMPFWAVATPKSSTLPSWFDEAISDPNIYVGVASPCDDHKTAEDMAIATAVLNHLFATGNCEAKIVGGIKYSDIDNVESTFNCIETLQSNKPIKVVVDEVFFNENNECFVACKFSDGGIGTPVTFTKSIYLNEAVDSLNVTSTFEMLTEVRKVSGQNLRTPLRKISGTYIQTSKDGVNTGSLSCNMSSFQIGKHFKYISKSKTSTSNSVFPIEANLGVSLYRIFTMFPPVLDELVVKKQVYETMENNSEIGTNFYLEFENKGQFKPVALRFIGLSDNNINYTLSQEELLDEFVKQYRDVNSNGNAMLVNSDSRRENNYSFDVELSKAYINTLSTWAQNYSADNIKGRVIPIEDAESDSMFSSYETNTTAYDFDVIWHTGDNKTKLPSGIVSSDFDYTCGVTVFKLDKREKRIAAFLTKAYDEIAKIDTVIPKFASTDIPKNKTPATVKFKFRTADNTKFSESDFKLTFTTDTKRATYHISGSDESHSIPEADLRAGVHGITLPPRDCDLTLADEDGKIHVLHFLYDEALSLRKSATLHILSIGVNDYPDQTLDNLKYAEDDARVVVDSIASRHQYTFTNINKTLLLGNDVTPERIASEIEKIADNARYNDLAIIFYAGHGLVDARNYYLATSKVTDKNVPRKGGFSSRSFVEKMGYINCKLVVFIDACYSAKMLESFRSGLTGNGEFFREITSTPNGTNIYMSSGADVRSRELDSYGHGAFTQALIEAFNFEKSDINQDGRITIKEIRNYLEQRIPEIAGKEQIPVHRNLEEIDYSLFIR